MSTFVAWAWLFTLPGLVLTGLGVGRLPGAASLAGPPVMTLAGLAWLLGPRTPAEVKLANWLPFLPDSTFHLRVDALSALMLVVVGAVSTCVYVYSLEYMNDDEYSETDRRRFFMFLDIFVATMAVLVLAGNLTLLLVGWAGVGLSSFLLISFRRKLEGSLGAGLQALAANAIGDAALLIAVVFVPKGCGDLLTLQSAQCSAVPGGVGTIALLLLIAASAKSAQGPLYFWLPSAMAGPTPVSALIHAATMVAAGVYLLVRTHGVFEASPVISNLTAWIGVITVLIGGLLSLAQTNFKRAIAYSTVSQLGYMFAAAGLGAPFAAMFHLVTHAAFKALLFLTAGVVIHANHGEEDMSRLGGLRKALPASYWCFLVGSLSLIGVPLFAGSFSKDLILEAAETKNMLLFLLLLGAVFITGWYTGRIFFSVFHGPAPQSFHGHESPIMIWPLVPLAAGAVILGYAEWPLPGLSTALGKTVGHAETAHLITRTGAIAAFLGMVGFVMAGYWRSRIVANFWTNLDWTSPIANGTTALAVRLTTVQAGHLGRYVIVSVLGVAVILGAVLVMTTMGVRATIR
jgi:NADH-quinone oxidoreductase subunit L